MSNLITKITEAMSQKNLSATDIEKLEGVNRNTVTSILNGKSKNPGIYTILSLAKALDVKVETLIYDEEEIQFDILKPEQTQLFAQVTTLIASIVYDKNISLSMYKINFIIYEIYKCASKGKPEEFQRYLAEHLIENHIKYIS